MMKLTTAGVLAAVVALGVGGAAKAGDYHHGHGYKKVVCYETVTCYETRQECYEVCVTRYDHCGKPYHAYVTKHRDVQVPVTKQVAVTKWVKVPAYGHAGHHGGGYYWVQSAQ